MEFSSVWHRDGKIALGTLAMVQGLDGGVDSHVPRLEGFLGNNPSVAGLIPGLGDRTAALLNAGIQLVGDVMRSERAWPETSGHNEVLIFVKRDTYETIKHLLAEMNGAVCDAKGAVQNIWPEPEESVAVRDSGLGQGSEISDVDRAEHGDNAAAVAKQEAPTTASLTPGDDKSPAVTVDEHPEAVATGAKLNRTVIELHLDPNRV